MELAFSVSVSASPILGDTQSRSKAGRDPIRPTAKGVTPEKRTKIAGKVLPRKATLCLTVEYLKPVARVTSSLAFYLAFSLAGFPGFITRLLTGTE